MKPTRKGKYFPPKYEIASNTIKANLNSIGMSPQEFADVCFNGEKAYVSRLIMNKVPQISLPVAFRIAKVLKQPIEKIFICKPVTKKE